MKCIPSHVARLVLPLLLALTSCASISTPIDGVVIDATTNKPIPGAFVIAQWVHYGSDGVGSRTSCPHLEVVQADAGGRYRIPEGPFFGFSVEQHVFPYKAGYERVWQDPYDPKLMTMRPFTGTGDARVSSYRTYSSLRACGKTEDTIRKLRPLYVALDHEAESLVVKNARGNPPGRFVRALQDLEEAMK
jgi:hypothetical protein